MITHDETADAIRQMITIDPIQARAWLNEETHLPKALQAGLRLLIEYELILQQWRRDVIVMVDDHAQIDSTESLRLMHLYGRWILEGCSRLTGEVRKRYASLIKAAMEYRTSERAAIGGI